MFPAVFLDRDGVLVEDGGLVTSANQLKLLPGVPAALCGIKQAHFKLVVVSNQAVIARGLVTEMEVEAINSHLDQMLQTGGAPALDGFFFCPHHPHATLPAYRLDCGCRKPKPGLLFRAAQELNLDLAASFMVGDRLTDVMAGQRAGCRTILVQTGKHTAPLIETREPVDTALVSNHTCADLAEAAEWILRQIK